MFDGEKESFSPMTLKDKLNVVDHPVAKASHSATSLSQKPGLGRLKCSSKTLKTERLNTLS